MIPLRFALAKQAFLVVLVGYLALAGSSSQRSYAGPIADCSDYLIIDSRGSGGPVGEISPPAAAFANEFQRLHQKANIEVTSNPYQAPGGLVINLGAILKLPLGYHQSVKLGKRWLKSKISALANVCSSTRIYLTGYSQGAQVTGDVFQEGVPRQVAGVALFGDPYFNSADKLADRGNYLRGLNGTLGARPPFVQPGGVKVVSYCHKHDPVCQGPLSYAELILYRFSRHNNYAKLGEPEMAARYFVKLEGSSGGPQPRPKPADKWPTKRNDGSTVFFMWVGANLLILPDWSSCDPNYCIVGTSDTVYVISLINEFSQIGWVRTSISDPRAGLEQVGVPDQDVDKLLVP